MAVASATALAAGVSYLARPQEGDRPSSSLSVLSDAATSRLADRPSTDDDDDTATPTASASLAAPQHPPNVARPFTVDALGRLAVSAKTLAVMDSWLASAGPTLALDATALAPLEARLRTALPPLAAERAWSLIRSYASFRHAERDMLQQLKAQSPLSSRELLDKTMALRRRHFDSVSVQELFGVQESRGLYASEVARILADLSLSEAQQAQRILALRMGLLPEVAVQEFGGAEFSFAQEKHAAEMRAHGENDSEVAFMRRQFVDVEGERSVLELENEKLEVHKQAWELRHPSFVRQRNQLLATEMDVEDKRRRLEQLLDQHFRPDELVAARPHSGL